MRAGERGEGDIGGGVVVRRQGAGRRIPAAGGSMSPA